MIRDVFGCPLDLDGEQDFSFILRYGEPFSVSARPASGCVCFGVEGARYGRLLIRFAGAPLAGASLRPADAAEALWAAMPAYQALYAHPALLKLQGHGEAAGGYAAIFRWEDGECLEDGRAVRRLQRLPLLSLLRMIDPIFDFHAFAEAKGYQAVGFQESCLTADALTGRLTLCDIDRYRPAPLVNDRGRMPGSARFLAPEEYVPGAPLDGLTMQYAMGMLAFTILADHGSRERGAWMAGEALCRVARRACAEDRAQRYPSYAGFLSAWRQAAGETVG